jgi:hypothetical protein
MEAMNIAIGLPSETLAFERWVADVGGGDVRVISAGSIAVEGVDEWIGVPAPPESTLRVNLFAPEPTPGEEPHWLEFQPFSTWTSDLIAVCVKQADPAP